MQHAAMGMRLSMLISVHGLDADPYKQLWSDNSLDRRNVVYLVQCFGITAWIFIHSEPPSLIIQAYQARSSIIYQREYTV